MTDIYKEVEIDFENLATVDLLESEKLSKLEYTYNSTTNYLTAGWMSTSNNGRTLVEILNKSRTEILKVRLRDRNNKIIDTWDVRPRGTTRRSYALENSLGIDLYFTSKNIGAPFICYVEPEF